MFAALPTVAEQQLPENSPGRQPAPEPQARPPGDVRSPHQETTIRGSEQAERAQQSAEADSPQTEETKPIFLGPPGVFNFMRRPVHLSEANKSRAMSLFAEDGAGLSSRKLDDCYVHTDRWPTSGGLCLTFPTSSAQLLN